MIVDSSRTVLEHYTDLIYISKLAGRKNPMGAYITYLVQEFDFKILLWDYNKISSKS